MTIPDGDVAAILGQEFIEQRKAYLERADAVARELGKLTNVLRPNAGIPGGYGGGC